MRHRRRTKSTYVVFLLIVLLAGCRRSLSADAKANLIAQGDALMETQDYNKAIAAYAAAAKGGQDGQLMRKLAQAYSRAGNFQQFYRAAIRAADLLPDDIDAQLDSAKALLRAEKFDDASARVEKVLAKSPNNVDALIQRGNAAAHLVTSEYAMTRLAGSGSSNVIIPRTDASRDGDAKAERAFRAAVELQTEPKESSARIALINFLWAVGRLDDTELMLKQLADDQPDDSRSNQALGDLYALRHRHAEAEHYLKRAAARPDAAGARRRLYNLYMNTNRRTEAATVLASLLATDDTNGSVSLRLALLDFTEGRRDEALRRVEPLLARKPAVPGASLLKARVLLAQGDWAAALPLARDAAAADARSSLAASTVGRALFLMGDLEGAYDAQTTARRLDPKAAGPLLELARLSLALGQTDRALTQAQDAVRLDPADREAVLLLARVRIAARDYVAADEMLKPLVAQNPSPDVLVQLGALHAARGNDESASKAFALALEAAPDSVDAVSGLVALDLAQKRLGIARKRADEALARHPREPGYLELASRVYVADHDAARAESTLRTLLEVQPGNLGAALALSRALAREHPKDARRVLEQLLERRPQATGAHRALEALSDR